MKKLIIALFISSTVIGCADSTNKNTSPDECSNCPEAKVFKINYELSEMEVSVYGRKMGTPDATIIDSYLKGQVVNNRIDRLEILRTGIEGGATYCVQILDTLNRRIILDDLQRIQTDKLETSYRLISQTESCMSD